MHKERKRTRSYSNYVAYYVTSLIKNLPTMKKRKEKRTKLDPSRKKGIFVGYNESSKAYKIYFLGFKKIDISMDVQFDEDSTYNKSIKRPNAELEETEEPRI